MINQRDAFLQSGRMIRAAGYVPALAVNIRPFTSPREDSGAGLLEYLHNWWLADALVLGCLDDDFDTWRRSDASMGNGDCEDEVAPAVDRLGLTFYGSMQADEGLIEFGLPDGKVQPLARRWLDFEPHQGQFRQTLAFTQERYRKAIEEQGLEFGMAEVGFSSGNISDQLSWLEDYYAVMEKFDVRFAGIHGIFQHAEFSTGKWYFHLIARCQGACELTPWGEVFASVVRVRSK